MLNFKKVSDFGQIEDGDVLLISADFAKKPIACEAIMVLSPNTDKEEVVFNKGRNHYFVTSMLLDGTPRVKEVYKVFK